MFILMHNGLCSNGTNITASHTATVASACIKCRHIYNYIYKILYIHSKILNETRLLASLRSLTLAARQLAKLMNEDSHCGCEGFMRLYSVLDE